MRGVGSLINIFPNTDYSKYIPKGTPAERIERHWNATGEYMRGAMRQVDEQLPSKKKE